MITLYNNIEVDKSKLIVEFTTEFKLTKIVKENFWAIYADSDLSSLDESILNIPVLLNIAPAIWAMNLHVRVHVLDEELNTSLKHLKIVLKNMYPRLEWGGQIVADKLVDNNIDVINQGKSALFFSGGLDSVFSTMSHLEERPILVTIRGSDVSLTDHQGWDLVKQQSSQFAKQYGLVSKTIECNLFSFLNQRLLGDLDSDIPGWWGGVQHGMGFAGLLAPISTNDKISTAYIASSHSIEFSAPWGSNPQIDNNILYSGLQCIHDGYEFTRHRKVQNVIRLCGEYNIVKPTLRVCYSNTQNSGENCCVCEKCSRTMTAFWIEKENPKEFGFNIPFVDFIFNIKKQFLSSKIPFNDNTLFMWQDIKNSLKTKNEYEKSVLPIEIIEYIEWFRDFDFISYKMECDKKVKRHQSIVNFTKSIPGLYPLACKFKRVFIKNSL